ncbi:MAG TPA: ATP-binding cassette domain-containing protein [Bryobacteraceae bacterium]|nr:ATP-binding cassette domain-containing protein [Bryobacteraceae bacterium]
MSPVTEAVALLEMRKVSVMRGERVVLHELDLRIGQGEHVALLGPNGCGKSTLIKVVNREIYPLPRPGSSLTLMGRERWNVWDLRSTLGVVSNDLMANCTRDFSGLELVVSGYFSSVGIWPHHEVTPEMIREGERALQQLNASHLRDRMMTEMSSGEARRVLIGRALVNRPKALLLDEPSTSLDVYAQHELREILSGLAQSGIGIILVTHHLSDVIPEIERVVLMSDGRVAADGPKEQVLQEELLSKLFRIPVNLSSRDGCYHLW